ncbi:MAG: NUDIX hydrolase [Planctomycetota bacterium]
MAYGFHPDTELIYQGARVNLRVKELPRRGGGTQKREVAEAADAVVILPLIEMDGQPGVVLIRNERFAVGQTLWELPAGTLEAGEDPRECAGRELEEETGYRAGSVEPMVDYWASPGFSTERMFAFVATDLVKTKQSLDETERIVPEAVTWAEALKMARAGQLGDGKTLATLLWWESFGRTAAQRA